jgi:hypothetical protein
MKIRRVSYVSYEHLRTNSRQGQVYTGAIIELESVEKDGEIMTTGPLLFRVLDVVVGGVLIVEVE